MALEVPELLLDPALKLWVLLPISVVMVLVGILRTYITMLLQPSPKLQSYKLVREQQHLNKLRTFKKNNHVFNYKTEFTNRLNYYNTEYSTTKYLKELPPSDPNDVPNPLTDPNSSDFIMQMVKSNAANYVPQTVIMWWVNFFFKGYVLMKLPFNLTSNFKSMLQSSINTPNLDASYVSSISWYFVNLLGLKSVYSLILNDGDAVNMIMQSQQQQQPVMPQLAGAGPTADKLFKGELEGALLIQFKSSLENVEDRFLQRFEV
ncbi:hypothetical protein CANARDRAFT_29711 [[Candida] arabinofermentans NRRL YB-2248]|uniref:ER membrane protein complex subunit 3 n=1 Tax=[Candida] arabinofermentans NRRL YB-2248 TaxID=983967 RepID=A0A1E4SW49_9ASCO|nr:hypothetical protein CANARDRAFT_29711 [[Candida] arabinofermentans NRRL YB-2248]